MLTFLDLFAGIGGFRLGMEKAGHKCLGHCEYDKFANLSYNAMHKPKEDEWFERDIREIRTENIPRADVWCFGFPCQDISVAGKQFGFRGERSSLFFTVTKLIRELKEEDRPKYLLIENVKNLLSVNGGFDFLKVLVELDEIGYDAEWQVLNSKNFGVPQNRERIFIVGHFRGRSTRKVFPIERKSRKNLEQLNNPTHSTNRIYDAVGIARCIRSQAGGGGAKTGLYFIDLNKNSKVTINARCLKAKYNAGVTNRNCDNSGVLVNAVLTPDRVNKRQNGRRIKESGELMFTLTAQDKHGILKNGDIRRLTPKECFRLQGFPDKYYERAASVCSDSQLYKQAGNAVTANVVYEIAKRMG
ncbi:DNA methyltransferase [Clostridium phage phiCDHM19]|uniref:Putative DNA methylase protein n=2 Tax=root TaxID=1 RepID=A0A090DBZ5_9CAUD|nr:DNA methyltransferase [Clostridium phage phiCDHM19]CDW17254.1 putative DNA methylase protein [Clostridium phage phiCDHM19]HBH3716610.1 DNA cytosine methyltransferase [Clostridioides difficile]